MSKLTQHGSAVIVLALVLLAHSRPATAISTFATDTALEPSGFSNLIAHPNDVFTWDLTNITWKFDPSFLTAFPNAAVRNQVRLAFQQWDTAFATPNGSTYSYSRAGGFQPFGDIRSIAVHELGHVLGLTHPDQGDAAGRNYALAGGGGVMLQADQNNEVMRSWINPGDYNHVLSHDELDGFDLLYGHDLNFTEVFGATPANIIIQTYVNVPNNWAQGGSSGVYRNGADHYQGAMSTSGGVSFNTSSGNPLGLMTLGQNWDFQNNSGLPVSSFEVRTRGTNNMTPLFRFDGFVANKFNNYGSAIFSNNFKDDVLHTWSNPTGGPIPATTVVHVGLEQDVWDWMVVSAQTVSPGNVRVNAPIIGSHSWTNTIVEGTPAIVGGVDDGITTAGKITVKAWGIRLANSELTAQLSSIGLADVEGMNLTLDQLNRSTLEDLVRAQKVMFPLGESTRSLAPLDDFFLILQGSIDDLPSEMRQKQNFILLNRPDLVGKELFVFSQGRAGDFTVGNYALIGRDPIVPEPPSVILLLSAGGALILMWSRATKGYYRVL